MLLITGFFLIQGFALFLSRQAFESIDLYLEEISIFLLCINSFFFVFVCGKKAKSKKEFMILSLALMLRICTLLWDVYARDIFVLPSAGIDTESFHRFAVMFARGDEFSRGGVYFRIVGMIYRLFGVQRINAQYFNVMMSMFSIFLVKKMLEQLNLDKRISNLALIMVAFLPNYVIMSSILLRESIIIFLITVSLYFFIKWWQNGYTINIIFALIFPFLAAFFHSGSISPAIVYALIYIFYSPKDQKYKLTFKSVMTAVFLVGCFLIIELFFAEGLFRQFDRIKSIDDIVNVTVRGASGYLRWMEATGTIGMIVFSPIRMFYFIASPLPWYWRGFNDIFGFFASACFYLYCYYFLFRSLRKKHDFNYHLISALLIMALSTTFMFAWGVNNAGTAMRHRDKFISIFVLAFAVCTNTLNNSKNKNKKGADANGNDK